MENISEGRLPVWLLAKETISRLCEHWINREKALREVLQLVVMATDEEKEKIKEMLSADSDLMWQRKEVNR